MLRPERMSKVSVTGSRAVMPTVIEAIHGLNLVHLSDYDGSWEGFDNGDPIAGAEEASERLVTVRALESTLDLDSADAASDGTDPGADWEERLESIRTRVNELDDRRTEKREEARRLDEEIDRVVPFADLGIDLDLLSGYTHVDVTVGEGPIDEVEAALAAEESIRAAETFTGGDVIAIVAAPTADADVDGLIADALVSVEFARYEVPDVDQTPSAYVEELESRRRDVEGDLEEIERDLETIASEDGAFLLGVEERLTIEVQQAEAPLQFATTDRSFVSEGWIPTNRYDDLVAALSDTVGDRVEVEELVRADYDENGHATHTEAVDHGEPESEESAGERTESPPKAATDGGMVTMRDDPPVIQDNVEPAQPFEILTKMINRPKYTEIDPTFILLLTFPAFFGYMIGDAGYGLIYLAAGFYMATRFDNEAIRALGGIGLWAGGFTVLFGVLYGEMFGLHFLGDLVFGPVPGLDGAPMNKGLDPANSHFASTWLVVSILAGLVHLTLGYVFGFINDLDHGVVDAYLENGSWALLMFGVWIWIFSQHLGGMKPDFLFNVFDQGSEATFALGFSGLPAEVGTGVGLPLLAIGLVTMIYGEVRHVGGFGIIIGLLESFNVLVNVLSYLRMAAVILAKAGMAFVVNMLFFGVYVVDGEEWHFGTTHAPEAMLAQGTYHGHEVTEVMFPGLMHLGLAGLVAGIFIFVIGHIVVLLLGITSAGLQGVRLEYVEFFDKFYEGGGRAYRPFGHDRNDD